ncbi:hypothetical protein AB0E74_25680 [Streptomyces sp. NPDC030392]|uniref:hypothetical protein n=1 Tax=Streptomyces sp. NPDC030392 TaxID=3155468 RepID=UPI0034068C00
MRMALGQADFVAECAKPEVEPVLVPAEELGSVPSVLGGQPLDQDQGLWAQPGCVPPGLQCGRQSAVHFHVGRRRPFAARAVMSGFSLSGLLSRAKAVLQGRDCAVVFDIGNSCAVLGE